MSQDETIDPEDRQARADEEAAGYQERLLDGTAEPREDFLAQHDDLRDLLEPILRETQTLTASIQPVSERSPATSLPDALQKEILAAREKFRALAKYR